MAVLHMKVSPYGGLPLNPGLVGMSLVRYWIATKRDSPAHLWIWNLSGQVVSNAAARPTKWR